MKYYIVPFFILIWSCGSYDSDDLTLSEWKDNSTLTEAGRWTISIDQETNRYGTFTNFISYSEDLKSLILFNTVNNILYHYPVKDTSYSKKVKLDKKGPNGTSEVSHFLFHNSDSLFFFNDQSNVLRIMNDRGDILYKKQIIERSDPAFSSGRMKMQFTDGNLIVSVFGHNGTCPDLSNKSLFIYNLKNETKKFIIDVPLRNRGYYAGRSRDKGLAIINDSYVVSPVVSPALQALKKGASDNETIEIQFGSDKLHYPITFDGATNDRQARSDYNLSHSWAESLYFDKHSRTLLRAWTVGRRLDDNIASNSNLLSLNGDRVFVITELFDEQLTKIGEVENVVFYDGIFSNEQAIYIMDYLFDSSNEDIISFTMYSRVTNEKE